MKKFTVIAFTLICFASSAQDKVYFPFFELINVATEYQYSTSKLLKTYMDQEGRYQMVLPSKPEGMFDAETFPQTRQIAEELKAEYFMTGEMNALEEVIIISVSLYKTSDGKLVWSDVLKGVTMDDLDPILQLLARAVGTKDKASQLEDIYSVSQYENQELAKKDASSNFGIYLGGFHTTINSAPETFSSGFGARVSYDLRDLILDINGEMYFGAIDIININLSALYPFKMARKSPFVGGALGYGSHNVKIEESFRTRSESESGLQAFAHIGYVFSRTSNVQLRLTVSGYTSFYKIDDQVPGGVGFNLGINF